MLKKFVKPFILAIFLSIAAATVTLYDAKQTVASADGVAEFAVEQESGTVLYEKNADKQLPMASTTKIMTALIIAEDCDLSDVIEVPAEAVGVEGSSIYLKQGERISIRDLLYGLMLRSGNDASIALAVYHSGTVEKFVEKMNNKAAEIGAINTHFSNPNGLPAEQHYTTARDLAEITRYAMCNEQFGTVVSTKNYSGDFRSFSNKNKLLYRVEGANGVKTGYTEKAGRCLVSSVKRNDMNVICVVLNCYDMFERSEKIIEKCFNEYRVEQINCEKIFVYDNKLYRLDENIRLVVRNGQELSFEISVQNNDENGASLKIFCQNNLILSHNLYNIN